MGFKLKGGISLKTPGAFQHVFLGSIFPRSCGTGAPFLAERVGARQDFFSFLNFFLATAVAAEYLRNPSRLGKTRPLSFFPFRLPRPSQTKAGHSPATPKPTRTGWFGALRRAKKQNAAPLVATPRFWNLRTCSLTGGLAKSQNHRHLIRVAGHAGFTRNLFP
jgi:hypothetical protein